MFYWRKGQYHDWRDWNLDMMLFGWITFSSYGLVWLCKRFCIVYGMIVMFSLFFVWIQMLDRETVLGQFSLVKLYQFQNSRNILQNFQKNFIRFLAHFPYSPIKKYKTGEVVRTNEQISNGVYHKQGNVLIFAFRVHWNILSVRVQLNAWRFRSWKFLNLVVIVGCTGEVKEFCLGEEATCFVAIRQSQNA